MKYSHEYPPRTYHKGKNDKKTSNVPAAAETPLRDPRTSSGKVRDGSRKVVLLGPKLLKKNVRLEAVPFAAEHNSTGAAGSRETGGKVYALISCLIECKWLSTQEGKA